MGKKSSNSISQEEAIALLINNNLQNQDKSGCFNNCMDEYGNYVFSTDAVISEPNIAFGSSDGFNFMSRINC